MWGCDASGVVGATHVTGPCVARFRARPVSVLTTNTYDYIYVSWKRIKVDTLIGKIDHEART